MLHLAELGLLELDAKTVTGKSVGENLDAWRTSDRRRVLRDRLLAEDGVDPDDVILPPSKARQMGFTSTVAYPTGNIAPEGSVVKATSIHPRLLDADGVYHKVAPCRTFTSESGAIQAVKNGTIQPGEVIVIMCRGPLGAGMPETYEVTAAIKGVPELSDCALITDARFSGVTTGPCFGHVSPEALAIGAPLGKLLDGDMIEIKLDTKTMICSINALADLDSRPTRTDLERDPNLPDFIRQWALVQNLSGGVWGGCVEDINLLENHLAK
jgi:dihydroxyacid dehydratase/phosphogluconate dehydratase